MKKNTLTYLKLTPPQKEFTLNVNPGQTSIYKINLENIMDDIVAFKVRVSNAYRYSVRTPHGYILPKESADLEIILMQHASKLTLNTDRKIVDGFQILASIANSNQQEVSKFWVNREQEQSNESGIPPIIQTTILKCQLLVQEPKTPQTGGFVAKKIAMFSPEDKSSDIASEKTDTTSDLYTTVQKSITASSRLTRQQLRAKTVSDISSTSVIDPQLFTPQPQSTLIKETIETINENEKKETINEKPPVITCPICSEEVIFTTIKSCTQCKKKVCIKCLVNCENEGGCPNSYCEECKASLFICFSHKSKMNTNSQIQIRPTNTCSYCPSCALKSHKEHLCIRVLKRKENNRGVLEFADGGKYEGFIEITGLPTKNGNFISSNGSSFEGEWQRGEKHGKGKETYESGGIFEGIWVNGKRHGCGKFSWPNGIYTLREYENGVLASEYSLNNEQEQEKTQKNTNIILKKEPLQVKTKKSGWFLSILSFLVYLVIFLFLFCTILGIISSR